MKKRKIYNRRMLAAILLGIFSFAITPKQFLHHFFAKHIDARIYNSVKATDNLNASGYHCNCYDLVAEMPFAIVAERSTTPIVVPKNYTKKEKVNIKSVFPKHLSDRGPPEIDRN